MYTAYRVRLQFHARLMGGVPKTEQLLKGWLNARGRGDLQRTANEAGVKLSNATLNGVAPENRGPVAEAVIAEAVAAEAAEREEAAWTGFKNCDEWGRPTPIYIEGRQIRALLKETAKTRGAFMANRGLGTFTQLGLWVEPKRIHLLRGDTPQDGPDGVDTDPVLVDVATLAPIQEPDAQYESAGHVIGAQGPRTILKRRDYVLGAAVRFHIVIMDRLDKAAPMTQAWLKDLLIASEQIGLGTDRTQDEGKFSVMEFELDPAFNRFRLPGAVQPDPEPPKPPAKPGPKGRKPKAAGADDTPDGD